MSERISATPSFTSRVHTRGQLMRTVGWASAQSRQMELEIKNKQKSKKWKEPDLLFSKLESKRGICRAGLGPT